MTPPAKSGHTDRPGVPVRQPVSPERPQRWPDRSVDAVASLKQLLPQRGILRLSDGTHMEWVRLGNGPVPLVLVPPISDGIWTVRSFAWRLAWRYRHHLRQFRMLALSRRQPIPPSFDVDRHADDFIRAVGQLEWGPAIWECTSAGGPIGQVAAVKRPDLVRGLILTVTTHRADDRLRSVLLFWRKLAGERRWPELYWSLVEMNARPRGLSHFPQPGALLRLLPDPTDPSRFIQLVDEFLVLDNSSILSRIGCPVLVIGGEQDAIIPSDLQREMAALIPKSTLVMYAGYGHAVPTQQADYPRQLRRFADLVAGRGTEAPLS